MLFTVVALELFSRIEMRAALLAIVLVGMCHVHLLMVVAGTARVRLMRSLSGDPQLYGRTCRASRASSGDASTTRVRSTRAER